MLRKQWVVCVMVMRMFFKYYILCYCTDNKIFGIIMIFFQILNHTSLIYGNNNEGFLHYGNDNDIFLNTKYLTSCYRNNNEILYFMVMTITLKKY